MATCETDGVRWERLVSRVSRLRRSRACALLLLNRKKKRDCSQSIFAMLFILSYNVLSGYFYVSLSVVAVIPPFEF